VIKIPIALLLLSVFAAPVLAADVSGQWRMSIKAAGVPELACTLSQKEQRLEGTCKAAAGQNDDEVELSDGRIDVDQVSWTWKVVTPDAITWTYAFSGKLDADGKAIRGIAKLSAGPGSKENEVSFTATKR
jgi:hypothetical protein